MKANGHTITCRSIVLATYTPPLGNAGILGATLFQIGPAEARLEPIGGTESAKR